MKRFVDYGLNIGIYRHHNEYMYMQTCEDKRPKSFFDSLTIGPTLSYLAILHSA